MPTAMPLPEAASTIEPQLRVVTEDLLSGVAAAAGHPVTVTVQDMARLTGVARERLRTWERRHGFPQPLRTKNGVRRYLADDVRHVAAVSQLAASGVPLGVAISSVLAQRGAPSTLESLGAALDNAPMPAIAISGPRPLRVAWTNGATRVDPDAPVAGIELDSLGFTLGDAAVRVIEELLLDDGTGYRIITHTDWMGSYRSTQRSIAWRLQSVGNGEPTIVLFQLPEAATGAPSELGLGINQQALRWTAGATAARRELQDAGGLAGVQRALDHLVRGTDAVDGFFALFQAGRLRTATSVRRVLSAREAQRDACPDLERAVADREVDWLSPETLEALGMDRCFHALAVPMVLGDDVGAAVLLFRKELAIGDAGRELLMEFGTLAAATVLRERARIQMANVRKARAA